MSCSYRRLWQEYLHSPDTADVARLLQEGETSGFPGMLGSIDCMHWEWSHYPSALKAFFTGRGRHPSMILEAAALHDLWIWHAYFGLPGSCNDINVLQRSHIFSPYERGESPLFSSQSMRERMTWGITLQMVYTLSGLPL
jgi:hypothetical protein